MPEQSEPDAREVGRRHAAIRLRGWCAPVIAGLREAARAPGIAAGDRAYCEAHADALALAVSRAVRDISDEREDPR